MENSSIEESIKDFLEMGNIKYLKNINIFDENTAKIINEKLKNPEVVHLGLFYFNYLSFSHFLTKQITPQENKIILTKSENIISIIGILIEAPYEQKELYDHLNNEIKKIRNKTNISEKLLTILKKKEKQRQSLNINDIISIQNVINNTINNQKKIDLTKSENPYQEVLKPTPITLKTHNLSSTTILTKASSFRTNTRYNEIDSSQKGKGYSPHKHHKSLSITKDKLKEKQI